MCTSSDDTINNKSVGKQINEIKSIQMNAKYIFFYLNQQQRKWDKWKSII